MQKVSQIPEQLDKLQKNYISSMPDKHAEITTYWVLAEQSQWRGDPIDKLRNVSARLSDSSALYGYSDINVAASKVSQLLQTPPQPSQLGDLQRHLQSLCSLLTIHAQDTPPPISDYKMKQAWPQREVCHLLCLVHSELRYEWLLNQLKAQSFQIELCTQPAELARILSQDNLPDMVLLDTGFYAASLQAGNPVAELKQQYSQVPLLFVSETHDFMSQLRSIQVGARAHLIQPLNVAQLLRTVDDLLMTEPNGNYRILLIEEEQKMALEHQAFLRQQGMQTYLINSPDALIEALVEFKPDLILLDTLLTHCNAYELATLIRQENAYLHIPIIFLLEENRETTHLDALNAGGNDSVARSISREHLLQLIQTQVTQSQRLYSMSAWDGLTGLLNHSHFMTHLNARIASAERAGSPVAIALLDIDDFHLVNQTHGYWIGNLVLKQVTRTLKQRLRRGDLLGRLYGDGFIIALHDADYASAQQVLESLIKDIGHSLCNVGNTALSITLSAGIAHYPGHIQVDKDPCTDILVVAKEAVKAAKQQGTGQVVIRSLTNAY